MKCPERFTVIQQSCRKPMLDENNEFKGEYSIFMENQIFSECFKENCAAWDVNEQKCKKF